MPSEITGYLAIWLSSGTGESVIYFKNISVTIKDIEVFNLNHFKKSEDIKVIPILGDNRSKGVL